jgi:hypothetical protein
LKEVWSRVKEWMQRDADISVSIWYPRKGMVPVKDLKDISIQGKVFGEDSHSRKVMERYSSFLVSVNPSFVKALCPFKEKRVSEQLVKDTSGKYLVVIEAIDSHRSVSRP